MHELQQTFEDLYLEEEIVGEVSNFLFYIFQGCSSVVKLCSLKEDPAKKFAVKIMRVPDEEFFDIAMKEFTLLDSELNNENIVKAYNMYHNSFQEKVYIILEYAGQGSDLAQLLKTM